MKQFYWKKNYRIILLLFAVSAGLHMLNASPSNKTSILDIYGNGKISLKPVFEISLDTLPEDVPAKKIRQLLEGRDKLYLSDSGTHDVKILTRDGKFIKSFGTRGQGPGDLFLPSLMCRSKNHIVVWDMGNRRFSFFTEDGQFLKTVRFNKRGFHFLFGLKALDDGRIIVDSNYVEGSEEKQEIFEWHKLDLYSSEMEFIRTVYTQREYCYKYFKNRKPYRMRLPFKPILVWDTLPGNKIITGYPEDYRLKIIDVDKGVVKTITRDYQPVRVTEKEKEYNLSRRSHFKGNKLVRGADKFTRDNIEFPRFKPAFKAIKTDKDGNIYVFFARKFNVESSSYKENCFDLFDSSGNFIEHVKIMGAHNFSFGLYSQCPGKGVFWCNELIDDDFRDLKWVKYKAIRHDGK